MKLLSKLFTIKWAVLTAYVLQPHKRQGHWKVNNSVKKTDKRFSRVWEPGTLM